MKFAKRGDRRPTQQTFDVKNTFIMKCGQKINQYDAIQEASEDTDIYKTLEKYGSIAKLETDHEGVFAEFKETMNLRNLHEQQIAAKNMWDKLPFDIREKFHNDRTEFLEKGENWLKKEIEKRKPQATETEKVETQTENKQTTKEVK